MRLKDKVALVVGGGGGIGRAISLRFGGEGAIVWVADLEEEPGLETVRQVEAIGREAHFSKVDASKGDEVVGLVRSVVDGCGRLQILVNCVIKYAPIKTLDMPEEVWDETMTHGLRPYFLTAKYAIPAMVRSGGGAIVNISSISGMVASVGNPAYVTVKGATTSLTKSLATDFARFGIRANAICPGVIATPRVAARFCSTPEDEAALRELYPLGRYGMPDDVAWAAVYLASDEASWVTGITLVVDGGLTGAMPGIAEVPSWRRRWLERPEALS